MVFERIARVARANNVRRYNFFIRDPRCDLSFLSRFELNASSRAHSRLLCSPLNKEEEKRVVLSAPLRATLWIKYSMADLVYTLHAPYFPIFSFFTTTRVARGGFLSENLARRFSQLPLGAVASGWSSRVVAAHASRSLI